MTTATALAHPNIAFIKYWGNCNNEARIPANGSISMNLDGLFTRTTVNFEPGQPTDFLALNGEPAGGTALTRVSRFLDRVRSMAGIQIFAQVASENNFPTGAGIASSASAFAALSLAASRAAGLELTEIELSRLARTGSGSACRSIPGGYVEWAVTDCDDSSAASSIAPPEYWDLVDCIAVVSHAHKPTGSTEGHALAPTSPLQSARVSDTPRRMDICRRAILKRDFGVLAEIVELDSNMLHAVMMTSQPPLRYWQPATIDIMAAVVSWRNEGLPAFYTIDAGPNVHVISTAEFSNEIAARLNAIPGVQLVFMAHPGGPARLVDALEIR